MQSTLHLRLLFAAVAFTLTGCAITIDHTDVFVSRSEHQPVATVALPPGFDRSAVHEVILKVGKRRYQGYRVASARARQAVLFMPGNGYSASVALSRLTSVFHNESTDLYLISYYQPSDSQPLVGEVYEMASALADLASTTSNVPKEKLIAVGHSLGGWITLHLAGTNAVGCAVVAGTGTTAKATASRLLPNPLAAILSLRVTDDVALLDNVEMARNVNVPTLVVGSESDEVMPVAAAKAIHQNLHGVNVRDIFISSTATHGGYFRDQSVLDAIRAFLRSRCDA